jgi:flagellar FliJ protein
MKKFTFRLQKLLDIKTAQERKIQHELSVEIGKQNVLKEKQQMLRAGVERQKELNHKLMSEKKSTIDSLKQYHRYSTYADVVIKNSQKEIDAMQPAIDEIRSRLSEAVKERRSIEKLKDRKFEQWKYQVKREEEKELDEINMKIFHRQKKIEEMSIND